MDSSRAEEATIKTGEEEDTKEAEADAEVLVSIIAMWNASSVINSVTSRVSFLAGKEELTMSS